MLEKSFIKGYRVGDNISLLNVIYHRAVKDIEGNYGKDSIDIIFKDLDTMQKKMYHIESPKYTFWVPKMYTIIDHWNMFIERDKVEPITCKYTDLKACIAKNTNNMGFFMDNIRNGNYKENDKLFQIPSIFNADMHIEDYYRWLFDRTYKNDPFVPEKVYFDIEVDGINAIGDFPQMGECPVNAITIVDEAHSNIYTLLLENYNNPLIDKFKKEKDITRQLKEFVKEKVGGWKQEIRYGLDKYEYHIMFYDIEIDLIKDAFNMINTIKPDFALAWNIAFDLP